MPRANDGSVPRSSPSYRSSEVRSALLVFGAILLYGLIHSLLASLRWKAWIRRTLGETAYRWYRLLYTLWAVLSFLPVLYLPAALPDALLYRIPFPWAWGFVFVQVVGLALGAWSLLVTDLWTFLGLPQALLGRDPEEAEALTVRGPYRWMRHPMYTASLLFLWFSPLMTRNSLAFVAGATLYFLIGGYFEERKLLAQFGEPYAAYRRRTPMLLPRRPGPHP